MKTISAVGAILFFFAMPGYLQAQSWKDLGPDELFSVARTEVFEGKREEGREKLRYILGKSPRYDDVKILLARSYSWDGLYDKARTELQSLLNESPGNRDALYALVDVELWSHNFEGALSVIRKAAISFPRDEQLLFKEASALASLGRSRESLLSLEKLLQIAPAHEQGTALYDSMKLSTRVYSAGVILGAEFFSRVFDPAFYGSAEVSRRSSWGSAHVRFNYAKRFGKYGSQVEVDLYPRISQSISAYFNYGYSASVLFPANRAGGELFFKLPLSLESSAGVRYMGFADAKVVMYTASLGWYAGNYWFSMRPFITPAPGNGTSVSGTVSARRYFRDPENYVGLSGGLGFSPDVRGMQNGAGLGEEEFPLLKSQRLGLVWQQAFRTTWKINLAFDVARQELPSVQDQYVIITGTFLSVRKRI